MKVAFKSTYGTYLKAPESLSANMLQQTYIGNWEQFYLVSNDDGTYALLNYHGGYVRGAENGGVNS